MPRDGLQNVCRAKVAARQGTDRNLSENEELHFPPQLEGAVALPSTSSIQRSVPQMLGSRAFVLAVIWTVAVAFSVPASTIPSAAYPEWAHSHMGEGGCCAPAPD